MANTAPLPVQDPIAAPRRPEFKQGQKDPLEGLVTQSWIEALTNLSANVDDAPVRQSSVTLTTQGGSIGATDLTAGGLAGGLFRITYYARITRAATTSSSLTITFSWTETSVSPSYSGAAITGNTTTTIQSGSIMIRSDANSPITYATTYASVGATTMQYRLDIVLESVPT